MSLSHRNGVLARFHTASGHSGHSDARLLQAAMHPLPVGQYYIALDDSFPIQRMRFRCNRLFGKITLPPRLKNDAEGRNRTFRVLSWKMRIYSHSYLSLGLGLFPPGSAGTQLRTKHMPP